VKEKFGRGKKGFLRSEDEKRRTSETRLVKGKSVWTWQITRQDTMRESGKTPGLSEERAQKSSTSEEK